MTVPVPGSLTFTYLEDGSTTVFSYPVRFLESAELLVIREAADGVRTTLVYNSDYTVSGAGAPAGGSITRTAVTNGGKIIITRSTTPKQLVDLKDAQRNPAEAVEIQLDRMAMAAQDLRDRALALAPGVSLSEGHFPEMGPDGFRDGGSSVDIKTAQANAALAAAALALFNTQYLGAYASHPTTDPAGGAIQQGAFYWSTASKTWFYWDGTGWGTFPFATVADGAVTAAKLADGPEFTTQALAEAYRPATLPNFVRLTGKGSAGDLGAWAHTGAVFCKEAAEPAHAAKFSITTVASAVGWFGLRGRKVVPELMSLTPKTDAKGPIADCIGYLSDNVGASRNGGVLELDEGEYNLGAASDPAILVHPQIRIRGVGMGTNAAADPTYGGRQTVLKYTGDNSLIKASDLTKLHDQVWLENMLLLAPNGTAPIVDATSWGRMRMHDCWLYGDATANKSALLLQTYQNNRTITGVTKGATTTFAYTGAQPAAGTALYMTGFVGGMTEFNDRFVTVAASTGITFTVAVDSTGYSNYSSGGFACQFVTNPTYGRLWNNLVGGVSSGWVAGTNANSLLSYGNRIQPNANGIGIWARSDNNSFKTFPNHLTSIGDEIETGYDNVTAFNFGATFRAGTIVSPRIELPGIGTVGVNAEAGAEGIVWTGGEVTAALSLYDPGRAVRGDNKALQGAGISINGADGTAVAGSAHNCTVGAYTDGSGQYQINFTEPLFDVKRFSVVAQAEGTLAICTPVGLTTAGVAIYCQKWDSTAASYIAVEPSMLKIEVVGR